MVFWTALTEAYFKGYMKTYKNKNNYVFKKKLTKFDVNLRVSPTMFIGARDVIDHVIPYPVSINLSVHKLLLKGRKS